MGYGHVPELLYPAKQRHSERAAPCDASRGIFCVALPREKRKIPPLRFTSVGMTPPNLSCRAATPIRELL
jgi:hypothetical protein